MVACTHHLQDVYISETSRLSFPPSLYLVAARKNETNKFRKIEMKRVLNAFKALVFLQFHCPTLPSITLYLIMYRRSGAVL